MSCPQGEVLRQLSRGELDRRQAFTIREHVVTCETCTRTLESFEVEPLAQQRLGRYLVLDELGRGGMGRVLRGFDPQLERSVAIKKLLHAGQGEESRQRLLREAQSMAKLVHPNIVSVFDAGLSDGEVYLVMEYVKGPTLHQWLTEAPRTWREVVRLFIDAGRGLAAAHAAGLVHRDFKPANVLVQGERAKVTDFGLALLSGAPTPTGDAPSSGSGAAARLTRAGATPGTPEYMAPEQFRGQFDARSDQFSFARSLEKSLQGRQPPGWLTPPLRRAQSSAPEHRFESVDALLVALDPERRSRRARSVAAAVAIAVPLTLAGVMRGPRVDCAAAAAAPLDAVWSASARRALDTRLEALQPAPAGRVRGAFAAWVSDWSTTAKASCEASAAGTQSEKIELLRRLCLDRRLAFFSTLIRTVNGPEVAPEQLVDVGDGLTLGACSDEALLAEGSTEEDPALRKKLEPLRAQLDTVEALTLSGREDLALVEVSACLERARAVGFAPFTAGPAVLRGQLLLNSDPAAARALFREAFVLANDPRGAPQTRQVAARAALEYFDTFQIEPAALEPLRPMIEGAVARTGNTVRAEGTYALFLGKAALNRGDAAAAIPLFEKSVRLRTGLLGPAAADTLMAKRNLAAAYEQSGDTARSVELYREALEHQRTRYGEDSLPVAQALESLGADEVVAVKYAAAREHLEAASRIYERHAVAPSTGLLDNLASMLEIQGDFTNARGLRERLLSQERDPLTRAKALGLMSRVLVELGKIEEARAAATEAITTLGKADSQHPDLQVPLTTLGRVTTGAAGDALLTRALALPRAVDHEYQGDVLRAMADRAQGQRRRELLKRARNDYAEAEVDFRARQLDALLR